MFRRLAYLELVLTSYMTWKNSEMWPQTLLTPVISMKQKTRLNEIKKVLELMLFIICTSNYRNFIMNECVKLQPINEE